MREPWAVVGRAQELDFVGSRLARAVPPRAIVIAGAAGVGKSRLAREAVAQLSGPRRRPAWAAATASSTAIPWGAFAGVIPAMTDPTTMLQRSLAALTDRVVGVDDAHLLDPMSATLLHRLVEDGVPTVVTLRTGEPLPDAVGRLLHSGIDRLELQPLARDETLDLARAILGDRLDTISAEAVWTATEGNVLFLRELLLGERDSGRLAKVGDAWAWRRDALRLPSGLLDLVEDRLAGVTDAERTAIDVVALAEPLALAVLRRCAPPDGIEGAETRGILGVSDDGERAEVRLGHPLFGEARRAEMSTTRARRLRGEVATAGVELGLDDPLRVGLLALDSDLAPDPALLTTAAQRALELHQPTLTIRFCGAAIDAGADGAARDLQAMALAFSWERGLDHYFAQFQATARSPRERAQATVLRGGNLYWSENRPADAVAILDHELTTAEAEARGLLLAARAAIFGFDGDPERARQGYDQAVAGPELLPQAVVFGEWARATAAVLTGRADDLEAAAANARQAVRRSPDLVMMLPTVRLLESFGARFTGDPERVERLRAEIEAEGFNGVTDGLTLSCLGHLAYADCRLGEAERLLRDALVILPSHGSNGWRFVTTYLLVLVLAERGDQESLPAVLELLDDCADQRLPVCDADAELARAWAAAALGSTSEALDHVQQAVQLARDRGHRAFEVAAWHTATRLGDASGADLLAELAGEVDGRRVGVALAHAASLSRGDTDGLLAASHDFEQVGDLAGAADAAAQASAHSDGAVARRAATRAVELAERCQGLRTPAVERVVRPLPLTDREREIVTLAASGHSNRDIAERLVVSVRTVEGHLYRASAKVGARNRADLAALLGRSSGA